ncbi:MAG: aspartate aminotransferase family protein [Rhodospirillales bacterium]|jgi:acetylornithine/N-succinyldiaminopimelate aminotransferase|nr:aspartate aminotransferase family protein [Rhodospirillales bacterium]MDP7214960.1 aspartate aminotransferase family protein [Rhodospirillales bacterium]HIJ43822.1 aspartate aminotransferase family protein [Rhodospirillaceae bacterium]HIJ44964.1 aspartate aminotransferase family protein [Rhodospirillaceae bacterium]HIJ93668.1 aspartate aminotransferase family protein [Rhodospirillaceae bacterium]
MAVPAVMPTYARADVAFERGEGAYLYDRDGGRFLDFAAGIAVNVLGHCHPHLVEILRAQAGKLWHTSNLYRIPEQERLAERLVANSFADTVFFANSGAEAVECGLKMVRRHFDEAGEPGRYRVICCEGAFHGRTLAAIAAGGQEKHLAGFDPVVEGFDQVAFGNLDETRAAITPETAAILVEPVQGEGGIKPASAEYLKGLRQTADEFGLLLFFDEVQCGMGRTGKLFAHEWAGVAPDVMALAKGLGGGFPIGACLATGKAAAALTTGSHGSTFGGNPLAMSVANGVLDVILSDGFLGRVNAVARYLRRRLEALVKAQPKVLLEVRGAGLMVGIVCVVDNRGLVARLLDEGLLSVAAGGNVVRLMPPLIIEERHVDEALEILDRCCRQLAAEAAEKTG